MESRQWTASRPREEPRAGAGSMPPSPCFPGRKDGASRRKPPKELEEGSPEGARHFPWGETEARRRGRTCSEAPSSTPAAQFCLDTWPGWGRGPGPAGAVHCGGGEGVSPSPLQH